MFVLGCSSSGCRLQTPLRCWFQAFVFKNSVLVLVPFNYLLFPQCSESTRENSTDCIFRHPVISPCMHFSFLFCFVLLALTQWSPESKPFQKTPTLMESIFILPFYFLLCAGDFKAFGGWAWLTSSSLLPAALQHLQRIYQFSQKWIPLSVLLCHFRPLVHNNTKQKWTGSAGPSCEFIVNRSIKTLWFLMSCIFI